VLGAAWPQPARSVATTVAAAGRPNILFVLTDDLDLGEVAQMPILAAQLAARGVTFTNAFVSVTVCCPSRATILRGQYSHNTGIETNSGANGGFATAYRNGLERSTIATWLQDAGYATAHFGKYLNGYPGPAPDAYVPPGWDEWYSAVAGDPYSQYDYTLNENGTFVAYGHEPGDYGTTVYTRKAQAFIGRAVAAGRPFFASLAVYAPHLPATPAPPDVDLFPGVQAPRTASYNEEDVSDKPLWLQAVPPMTKWMIANTDSAYRKRIQSLQSVDRAIGELIGTLRDTGQLDNTFIVFASDNGFHLGQHRLQQGKQTAYEEDVHVPIVVRGPGVPAGRKRGHFVGNIDFAPTFAALAGVVPPPFVDGRSFAQVMTTTPPPVSEWRHTFLIEHWQPTGTTAPTTSPLEPPDADELYAGIGDSIPEYHGIRTSRHKYVEYVTGEKELYDLALDPAELNNLAGTATAGLLRRLHAKVAALQVCAGESCRIADR
jgi:arylsulfatase A-like enzyme